MNIGMFAGDASIIVALYEYMHTVDVNDNAGRTPLHYAAIVGNEETLTTLLLCNPDSNRISNSGTSAVHEAIIHNHARTSSEQRTSHVCQRHDTTRSHSTCFVRRCSHAVGATQRRFIHLISRLFAIVDTCRLSST
jgi:hypothetical protein